MGGVAAVPGSDLRFFCPSCDEPIAEHMNYPPEKCPVCGIVICERCGGAKPGGSPVPDGCGHCDCWGSKAELRAHFEREFAAADYVDIRDVYDEFDSLPGEDPKDNPYDDYSEEAYP